MRALLLTLVLSTASTALAQDAQHLYMQGAAAYGDARYQDAAALFEQAYALRAEPSLLYNGGLAYERAGDVAHAIEAYEHFLRDAPDATERTEVERSLETLRRQRDLQVELEQRQALAVAEVTTPPPAPAPAPPPARTPEIAPWIVLGVGVVTLGAAIGVGAYGAGLYDQAKTEPIHARAFSLEQQANDFATAANVLFVAGGVVALAGAIWGTVDLVTLNGGDTQTALRVGPGGLSIAGTF